MAGGNQKFTIKKEVKEEDTSQDVKKEEKVEEADTSMMAEESDTLPPNVNLEAPPGPIPVSQPGSRAPGHPPTFRRTQSESRASELPQSSRAQPSLESYSTEIQDWDWVRKVHMDLSRQCSSSSSQPEHRRRGDKSVVKYVFYMRTSPSPPMDPSIEEDPVLRGVLHVNKYPTPPPPMGTTIQEEQVQMEPSQQRFSSSAHPEQRRMPDEQAHMEPSHHCYSSSSHPEQRRMPYEQVHMEPPHHCFSSSSHPGQRRMPYEQVHRELPRQLFYHPPTSQPIMSWAAASRHYSTQYSYQAEYMARMMVEEETTTHRTRRPVEPQATMTSRTRRPAKPQETMTSRTRKPVEPQSTATPRTQRPAEPQETMTLRTRRPVDPQAVTTRRTQRPVQPQAAQTRQRERSNTAARVRFVSVKEEKITSVQVATSVEPAAAVVRAPVARGAVPKILPVSDIIDLTSDTDGNSASRTNMEVNQSGPLDLSTPIIKEEEKRDSRPEDPGTSG